jgi:hypothetical protein
MTFFLFFNCKLPPKEPRNLGGRGLGKDFFGPDWATLEMPLSIFLYQLLLLLMKTEIRFQMEVSDVQKLGAGLATFGIFFLLLGVLLLFEK